MWSLENLKITLPLHFYRSRSVILGALTIASGSHAPASV